MKFRNINLVRALAMGLCASVSMPALAAADGAETADAADAGERAPEIIVIGKTYDVTAGKTVTPLKDIPNTVTVLDRVQMEEQGLFTLEDAMTITPGITVNGVGSEDPSFLSRGFTINNYLVDGTPTLSFAFPAVVPDLFFYDRMEILRGPAGLFSGSGNPAGSINMVRKRPGDEFKLRSALSAGSWKNFRGELDVNIPLDSNVAVRGGVLLQDQDQFFDVGHRNRLAAFAVGRIKLGEATTFTAGFTYDRFKPAIQSGLPGYIGGQDGSDGRLPDISRKTYLGADWNRFRSDIWTGFLELEHKLSDRWTIRASGMASAVERQDIYSYIGNQPISAANAGVTNHIAYRGDSSFKTRSADLNLIGSFSLFGRDQTLILGVDYQWSSSFSYFTRLSNYAKIDIFNPVSPTEPPLDPYAATPYYPVQGTNATCPNSTVAITPAPTNCVLQVYGGTYTRVEQRGAYGQLRLSTIEGVTLIGGGRATWWETRSQTLLPRLLPTTGYKIKGRFTPYLGAVVDVTDDLNIYGSYADSFTPTTSNLPRADGRPIEPLIGAQYEVGTKLALFNDKLLLSLAGYQITQSNRVFSDADVPGVIYQLGKVRARGIEAEAHGEILPGWRLNGGYSYTRTKYLEDTNPLLEGISLVPVIPHHSFKAFTNYAPVDGALQGFSVGGGLTWFSSTWGGSAATYNTNGTVRAVSSIVRQSSYAVVDLRAGYKLSEQLSFSLNLNNVLDRTYFSRISSTGRGNYFGTPRSVLASVRLTYP